MNDSNMTIKKEKENIYIKRIKELISQYETGIIRKSLIFFLSQNYREAEILLLSECTEKFFNTHIVQYLMGLIKLKLGEYESAMNYLENSLSNNINILPYAYDSRGLTLLLENKNYKLALRNFKDACRNSRGDFHFHNHLAICYKIIYNKQIEKNIFIDVSEKWSEKYSENTKNKIINNSSESNISISKSIISSELNSIDDKEKERKKKLIKKLEKIKENGKKIRIKYKEALKEALDINPNSYISLLNLGTYYAEEGEIDQAEKYYKKAELINKQTTGEKDWKIYINLAFLAFQEKEYPLSMGYFEIVFKQFENKINKKILKIYIIYMICLYKNKEWKKLEKISKKILILDKNNKKALVYLILSLEKNKKTEDLSFILKKVKSKMKLIKQNYIKESSRMSKSKSDKELENNIKSPLLNYQKLKAIIKQKLKKANEDMRIEQQGFVKGQNTDSAFEDIGRDNLRSFGFKHDFIEKIMELQSKSKDNVEVLFNLGYIYYKEEEFTKSEEYFKKVLEINPEYKKNIINEYLGDIYMDQYNSPEKALVYYNHAQSLFNLNISSNIDLINNISSDNINIIYPSNELLLVKIGLCYENLDDNISALKYYKLAFKKNEDFVNPIFHMGCIYDKMNKSEEALKWLEIAYEKEKENVDYLQKYGDCLVKSNEENNISKGILILEKGIEFFTGNIDITSSLAKGYEKQGRLKEAIILLEKAKNNEEFYNNKSKIFQLAFYYEKNKELTKAIEYFKKVLFLDKKNVDALLHIGYIYRSIKENVKAFKCFKQVLNLEKNNFLAYYGLARLYQSLENHNTEAINCYKNCLTLNPESIKANLQLGIIYLKTKSYEESLKCLQKVIKLDNNNITALVAIGNVYLEMKQYSEAKNYLVSALKLDKKNIAGNAALGDAYFGMNEINEALQKYIYVNRLNENIPEVQLNLGHCFFINEKFDSAISHYLKAIKLVKNTRHDYYYFLGNALIANYRFKDGIIAYQAAIKLKPNKLNYYYTIAKACYLEKLNNKGIKYLEKLLSLEKDKNINKNIIEQEKDYKLNDVLFLLYKLYVTLPEPDYNKCLSIIKTLIKNEPKNVEYLTELAGLQEKKSNFFEAIKTYKQILVIEPNHSEAKKKLNLLDINHTEKNQKKSTSENNNIYSNNSNESNNERSENSSESNKTESKYSENNEKEKSENNNNTESKIQSYSPNSSSQKSKSSSDNNNYNNDKSNIPTPINNIINKNENSKSMSNSKSSYSESKSSVEEEEKKE